MMVVKKNVSLKAGQGDAAVAEWLRHFNKLSEQLGFKVNECIQN